MCHWFFELLNSQTPFLGPPLDEWGPPHFWHDVNLSFYYASEQNVTDYYGAEIVSLHLLSLVKEEYLFLSPALDSCGLKCASSWTHALSFCGKYLEDQIYQPENPWRGFSCSWNISETSYYI